MGLQVVIGIVTLSITLAAKSHDPLSRGLLLARLGFYEGSVKGPMSSLENQGLGLGSWGLGLQC